jgi:hypothetical protein
LAFWRMPVPCAYVSDIIVDADTRPLTLFLSGSTVNIETSCLAFPDRVDQRREVNDRPIPQGATRHRLNLLSEC